MMHRSRSDIGFARPTTRDPNAHTSRSGTCSRSSCCTSRKSSGRTSTSEVMELLEKYFTVSKKRPCERKYLGGYLRVVRMRCLVACGAIAKPCFDIPDEAALRSRSQYIVIR